MSKKIFAGLLDLSLLALAVAAAFLAARYAWTNFYRAAFPVKYEASVILNSETSGVPPSLLFAVIRTESGFDPLAESHIPARGLMQITQDTFEWIRYRIGGDEHLTYDDMFDPETNIRYGAELLCLLRDEFGSDEASLSAYHMGWGAVKKWLQDPGLSDISQISDIPSGTARRYVDKVLRMRDIYDALYDYEAGE